MSRGKNTGAAPGVYEALDVYEYTSPLGPEARFSAVLVSGVDGETFQFTDASIPGAASITGWLWDFGDGMTSAEQNPSHESSGAGLFNVRLTVTNAYGSDVLQKDNFLAIGLPALTPAGGFLLFVLLLIAMAWRKRQSPGKDGGL